MRALSRGFLVILAVAVASVFSAPSFAQSVRVACPRAIPLYYLPIPIAVNLGLFKKQGLEVEVVDLTGANAAKALISGSVEFSCNSLDHAIKVFSEGQSVKMVAGFQRLPGLALVAATKLKGEVKDITGLKGRSVGVGVLGSSTHLSLIYLLKKNNMTEQDVRVVSVPGPPFVAAIKAGQLEGGMNLEPYITRLLRQGDVYLLADLRTVNGTRAALGVDEFLNTGVLASQRTIAGNAETVQKFVNAVVEANKWIQAHTPEQIAAAMPSLGDLKPDFIAAMETLKEAFYADAVPTKKGVDAAVEFHKAIGTVDKGTTVNMGDVVDVTFVSKATKQ